MKNRKFIFAAITSIILSCIVPQSISAQGSPRREHRKEQIDAMKVGFITRELQLSPDEAKVFWPIYDRSHADLRELRKNNRKFEKEAYFNLDKLSEKELTELADNEIIFDQKELDIRKKYHAELKAVLSPLKLAQLYRAEDRFRKRLLEEMGRHPHPRR